MVESNNYQMAIDMLRCHLGLSEEEARKNLGLEHNPNSKEHSQDTSLRTLINPNQAK